MLMAALKAEAAGFVAQFAEERLPDGRQRVVLHGAGPERTIQTGIGAIPVRRPKVRDRATDAPAEEKIRFSSSILPKWARRSRSLDALLPILYLRGVSTGDFQEALTALLGKDAPNLSPGVISRLTDGWQEDYERWSRRDLSARRYVYIWADGVYLQARMEPTAECMLVVIGATPEGKKELLGFQVGVRESAQSWRELGDECRSEFLDDGADHRVEVADLVVQLDKAAGERLETDPIRGLHVAICAEIRPPGGEGPDQLHAGHAPNRVTQSVRRADDGIVDHLQGDTSRRHGGLPAGFENTKGFHHTVAASRRDGALPGEGRMRGVLRIEIIVLSPPAAVDLVRRRDLQHLDAGLAHEA
jgi:hypothetical protein